MEHTVHEVLPPPFVVEEPLHVVEGIIPMSSLDTTLRDLPAYRLPIRVGDEVHGEDGEVLGSIDRATVTPDLHHVSHVGVQPVHHWEWPRLVPVQQLSRGGEDDDHVLVLHNAAPWPSGYQTADMIPGMREDELPDHPRWPVSGVQVFFMALMSPGMAGELGVAARIRERLPEGETALREGSRLLGWSEVAVSRVGEILGLVADADGDVHEVLVSHRHGLGRRMARLPIDEVRRAGIDEASTPLGIHELERFDVATDG